MIYKMAAVLNFRSELLYIFLFYVALILSTRFRVNWPFGSEKEAQKDGYYGKA